VGIEPGEYTGSRGGGKANPLGGIAVETWRKLGSFLFEVFRACASRALFPLYGGIDCDLCPLLFSLGRPWPSALQDTDLKTGGDGGGEYLGDTIELVVLLLFLT
jgi:hypothetical protein